MEAGFNTAMQKTSAQTRRERLATMIQEKTQGNKAVFAQLVGKKASQISDMLSGSKSFGEKVARDIERKTGYPERWLDGDVSMPAPERPPGKVPLLTWQQLGQALQTQELEWIATVASVTPHMFALRVEGESMEPRCPPGTILIVDPDREATHGNYVIARDGVECTFKQYVKDGSDWYLKPLNDRYPVKRFRTEMSICGVVVLMQLAMV